MSYQMWGLASCPEICMTSTVLRVCGFGLGEVESGLFMKSLYPKPFSMTS